MSFKETGGVTLGRRSGFLKMANSVTVPNTWDQIEAGSKFDADSHLGPQILHLKGPAISRRAITNISPRSILNLHARLSFGAPHLVSVMSLYAQYRQRRRHPALRPLCHFRPIAFFVRCGIAWAEMRRNLQRSKPAPQFNSWAWRARRPRRMEPSISGQ